MGLLQQLSAERAAVKRPDRSVVRCAAVAVRVALCALSALGCGDGRVNGGRTDGGNGGGGGGGGSGGGSGGAGGGGGVVPDDPVSCAEAAGRHSYVGCDFWPVALYNMVDKRFDFTAVVANAGAEPADVMVTGPGVTPTVTTVPPRQIRKLYLPWVARLQFAPGAAGTVKVGNGAFHLTSTRPVTVYQFNPLEYDSVGGPPGKDWACGAADCSGFYSYSNDASLLLPATAMTGNYRITGFPADAESSFFGSSYFAVIGTEDGTTVNVKLGGKASVAAGDLPARGPGGTLSFGLRAGEVAQILTRTGDLSGSLVQADKPVEVIAGTACSNVPAGIHTCDHLEETVLPVETLGRRYHVTVPSGPDGKRAAHVVRLYGNSDGTALAYAPGAPPGAPATINAGGVVDLGIVTADFEVTGSHAFALGSFMIGKEHFNPGVPQADGDPSQTTYASAEQYRRIYVFLAPDDYHKAYADVVAPTSATLELDGAAVTAPADPIGSTGFGVHRIELGPAMGGGHLLEASAPVGLQVIGYGLDTSYQFPGGLNLRRITTAPSGR